MEPPAFPPSGLATVRAAPGSDATLALPLPTGTPPFNYQWSRAGASLDERFTASDDASGVRLTVSAARTGDTNVYTLQASNAAGSDTSQLRLEVCADEAPTGEDPPTFLRRLQDLTVKVGTRTRFLVEIISSTECKVTWFRNERRLLEAERVALARDGNFWCADVAAVSVDDAGRWTCTAENAGGRASCSAHLNVLVPKAYKRPEFVEELRALLTEQGTVSLECKVVGVPTPVLRWFKDSREIKAGDVFALTANAEDPTSLGTYTCEAVNCMGRAYSSSKVHVVGRGSREGSARPSSSSVTPEPPPIFTKELEDQFVRVCEPLTLGCHIVVPPWPRSVVWYNKEGKIEPSERYHVLEDGAGGYLLEVGCAEWPDEGEWKCVATSTGGRIGISTCYVTMDVPKNYRKPRFMENLQAVLTEEGLVSFECKVVGFPTPVLSWFKDGQELKPGDVYQLTGTNSLGSYCCIARNCMGQASSSAELTVEDIQNQLNEEEKLQLFSKNQAPKFIQGLKSVEAKIDEPFRFTVKVAIPPEPSVLWYRDDQPVDETSRCHLGREERGVCYLDIQSLEFLDQAEWKCVAMNDFGHSVTSCFLKLIIPRHYKKPRFLENLQAILSDEGAVNLECKVIGVPQPVLKWYKDGEELKPGDIHRIISGQDGTCCLGTYTCEAQNCMGIAASSASLLGFDDSMKAKKKKAEEQALQRNLSLSTIHEERTSQMYDTPVGDVTTLDDKGEISFSFDGKEVSVSLYETPDLTEEEALQIVEMYADQLSENITEHNVVELPPLRFVKETSTSGNLLMEAVIIDVSPEYFVTPDEDMRTEADLEDLSIADENGPPQLSLDQDFEIAGEDYLEKTMALLSDERSDIKLSRKKSDSQRSADDFFSLSRDQSLSEEKRDDDTQAISDLQSFASAHSSGKPKSKSLKPSGEDGQESSEPTKTILFKDEALKHFDFEPAPVVKPKRERRTSRSSRRSSSGSEKSVSKSREEALRKKESFEMEMPPKPKMTEEEFKNKMVNISTSLSKVINDVQIIERDIILKSELMSSAATASRSLEIISSLISPLSEIHSIADAAKESASETKEVSSTLFNSLPQPLKALQQSLTIIEKCIDMESDSKTLVKKTCVAFVETCGSEMQKLISEINSVTSKDYLLTEDRVLTEIESLNNEMSTVIKFSADTIKARNLLSEASEIKVDEPSLEVKHLRDTQKAVFELKAPLISLLCIAECAETGKIIDVAKVRNSEVILNDMYASIQDLQTALEQIETLSVKESNTPLQKYNTEIIETVMESVVKLRSSFEQLSTESDGEDEAVLKQAVASIKENLHKISTQIEVIENNVGTFDVLQSENKLDALQKMAQILIALENNLPRLEPMPEVKNHMTVFHKNLTKVLENVIESNESKKYFALMETCDAVNRINTSIKNLDVDNVLSLASLNNTLRIIQDQFITNVFDSELNCSLLTNIADTLVDIQQAINTAEEVSIHIDSEHIQPITPHEYDKTKAKVVMEHIDQAIAAIENVKAIESTQDFKTSIAPTLENICPVLEELKRSVASIKASGFEEEHISDISEISSFAQIFATPLCELNQNIIILNQHIVENIESLKQNSEIMATIAEPIHELHMTLEILQQDVISQYAENLTPYDVSVNMASAVQNLQSCILIIQEQAGVEAVDDMSTLEDISGIKTTADTIPSDRLVLPAAEETTVEQAISPFNQELQTTATAQALQTLHEHITVLQNPEIIDALDTLSEVSDYSSLKSFVIGLGELHSGIEEVLHPLLMEGSNEIPSLINSSKLAAIAEPMQELQQSLSVLDTSNIPIYENLLEMPTEKIHSVIQSVSEFKEHLDKCMLAVFPAMHTADNTVEIANKVGALREVCVHLKDIIETTKVVENIPMPEEVKALELTVDSLLSATDVSKGIRIEQVKMITEELYEKVATVQEEMIKFTPQAPEKLAQEAKLIQTIDEVQSNIAVLEQYDFVDLSRASDLTCTSPQIALEIESDSLMLMEDIVDSAVNVVQDSSNYMPIADLMIVEDFFKTCKNEFTILRCLISKSTTHKKIIRLLQQFSSLQSTINDFKTKKNELKLTDDVNGCLATFLIHTDDCLQNIQPSLIKIVDSQAELLIEAPLAKFENSAKEFKVTKEIKHDEQVLEIVDKFVEILEIAKPSLQHVQADILEEIKSGKPNVVEDSTLVNLIEKFATFVEEVKMQKIDVETKDMLEKVSTVIEKHHDFKDASGTGTTLILLKCLAECTDVLQESLLEVKVPKQKLEEGPLKAVLTEMLEPLQALHSQLTNVQEQVLRGVDEDSISVDITTTESLVQTMTEKHKEIIERMETEEAIANEEISLIIEVDKEIQSIQDSLRSIENVQVAQVVKEIAKPVEDIEKSMQGILSSEKANIYSEDKLPKEKAKQIIQHIDQYIELIEIVEEISAIIKIDDIKETMDIAKELRESIAASEIVTEEKESLERVKEVRKEQNRLALKLHTALSALQVQVFDSVQELAPALSTEVIQRIARVTAQLQADLVAVTGIRVALQAPAEPSTEILKQIEVVESKAAITTPELVTSSVESEATILEQISLVAQVSSSEQLIATTEMLAKSIAESKEIVTVEDAKHLSSEIIVQSGHPETEEVFAIEGTEAVILEQTEAVYTETVRKEDVEFSVVEEDQAQGVASVDTLKLESESAVMIEDLGPALHAVSVDEQPIDVGISQQAELQMAPKATIELLVLHIDQFISDDITEVINELANVINAEELKQSISIAKEMRENIAASEVELKAETSDVLKEEVIQQYAKLAEKLHTALAALETLPLDTLADIPSINKDTLQRVAAITENLRADLVVVKTTPKLFDELKDVKLKKLSDATQLKASESKMAEATVSTEQLEITMTEVASVKPTVSEDKESVAAEVQRVEEDAELQEIKHEPEKTDLLPTSQPSLELAETELFEVDTKFGEALAVTTQTEPIILEEVTVSDAKAVAAEQVIQKSEQPLQKATAETLLQTINEFLSDETVQTLDKISTIMNVVELKQSVAIACDLRKSIEAATDNSTTTISMACGEQLQLLQNTLSTVQTLSLDSICELKQVIGKEALQQLTNTSTHLSSELATVILQVYVPQETLEGKREVEESTIEPLQVESDASEEVIKQADGLSENMEHKFTKAEMIVKENVLIAESIELPTTSILEDIITADVIKILDQGVTKVLPEHISVDTIQAVTESGDDKSLKDKIFKEEVIVEQLLTETVETTVDIDKESMQPSEESRAQIMAKATATATITGEDTPHRLEKPDAPTKQGVFMGEDNKTGESIISDVASVKDLNVEDSLPELAIITKLISETIATTQDTPTEQLTGDALQTPVIVTEQQVQSDQDKTSTDLVTNELSLNEVATIAANEVTKSQKQEKSTKEVSIDQVAIENVRTDVVTEEIIIIQPDIAPEVSTVEEIAGTDSVTTTITVVEDSRQQLKLLPTVTDINEFGYEIVNAAIVIPEEAIQPLVLEKEEVLDPQIPLEEIDVTKVFTAVHESAETSSTITKERPKDMEPSITENERVDIKVIEESYLHLAAQETVSIDQASIGSPGIDAFVDETEPLEQEKSKDTAPGNTVEEIIETGTGITAEEKTQIEPLEAKAITVETPVSENIVPIAATTTEEKNLLKKDLVVSDTVITEKNVAVGKETTVFIDAVEVKPLKQDETASEHANIDQSGEQELKVIITESKLDTESVETTAAIDVVESQSLKQGVAISDAIITEQPVAADNATTTCIETEEIKPSNQEETATEHGNVGKSFEQEPKVNEAEAQFDAKCVETTAATNVAEPQLLEQLIILSDAIITEQPVAGKETTESIEVEEIRPLHQKKAANEHANVDKSIEQETKIIGTEAQFDTKCVETTVATDVVEFQSLEQDIAISDANITEQLVATVEKTTSNIETEELRTSNQEETASKHVSVDKPIEQEPKVIGTESKLDTETVEITAATDVMESQSLEQGIAISDAIITKQPVAVDKETTTIIEMEEIRPSHQKETASEHVNVDKSVEQELEITGTEAVNESVEIGVFAEVVQPPPLEKVNIATTSTDTIQTTIEPKVLELQEYDKIAIATENTKVSAMKSIDTIAEAEIKQSEQEKIINEVPQETLEENISLFTSLEITGETKVSELEPVTETRTTELIEDTCEASSALRLPGISETVSKQAAEESVPQPTEATKITLESGGLIQHIDEFVSDEISQLVGVISGLTKSQELNESIELAKVLKESIEYVEVAEKPGSLEEAKVGQAKLVQRLQDALSNLHTKALESAEEIAPMAKPDALQRVSEIITHLQEDLEKAFVSVTPLVLEAAEITVIPEIEENSLKQLEVLLQEVTDKINLPTFREVEDNEALRDALDEVQTVIIKLKRDYDGAANDTLNETLEDLECSVRSVQLQINEDSPPELLQEACATLQLLVNNMRETQEVQVAETSSIELKNETILDKCSTETDETLNILEQASKVNIKEGNLAGIVSSLNNLKDTIKTLKLSFADSADVLIEKGVDVIQILDQLEDKVFTLEKDLAEVSLRTEILDQILTAVHSVYGSISNMRGTISSIQKIYMFENYGKPSETLLRSIKNVSGVLEIIKDDKQKWKALKKSLRKVLNHFEDIKFYINLDKTARLPSDAAFTKIIIEELKSNLCEILIPQASVLGPEAIKKVNNLLECLNRSLTNIESRATLEVKEKIPVFKELSSQIYDVTDYIKTKICELSKETKLKELEDQEHEILENQVIRAVEQEIYLGTIADPSADDEIKEKLETNDRVDDISKAAYKLEQITELNKIEESVLESPSTSQATDEGKKRKVRKQVMIQEMDIKTEIEQIASELVNEIAAQAIATVENLEELGILTSEAILPEAMAQSIEVGELHDAEISKEIETAVEESINLPDGLTLAELEAGEKTKIDESNDSLPIYDDQIASVSLKVEDIIDFSSEQEQKYKAVEAQEKESEVRKVHADKLDIQIKLEDKKAMTEEQEIVEKDKEKGTEFTEIKNHGTEESVTELETKDPKPEVSLQVAKDVSKQDEKEQISNTKKDELQEQEEKLQTSKQEQVEEKQTKGGVSVSTSTGQKQGAEETASQASDNKQEDAEKESETENELTEKIQEVEEKSEQLSTKEKELSKTTEKDDRESKMECQKELEDVHEAKHEMQKDTPDEKQHLEENLLQEDVAVLQKDYSKNLEEACKLEEKSTFETEDSESERKSQKDNAKSKQAEEVKSTTEEMSLLEDEKLTFMLEQKGIADEEQKNTQRKDIINNQEAKLLKELEIEREVADDGTKLEKKLAEEQKLVDIHEKSEETQPYKETDDHLQTETDRVDIATKEAEPKKSKKKTKAKESENQQTQEDELKEQLVQKHELELKLETEQKRDVQLIASETQDVEKIKKDAEMANANQKENQSQIKAETKQDDAKTKQEKEKKTPVGKQKSEENILKEGVAVPQNDNVKNLEEACKLEEKTTEENESKKSGKDELESKVERQKELEDVHEAKEKAKHEMQKDTPDEKQNSEENLLQEDVAVLQKDNAKNLEQACKLEEKPTIETEYNESERKSQKGTAKSKQAEEVKSSTEEISLLEDENLTVMLEQKGITDEEQIKTQRRDTKNNQEAKLLKELENEKEVADDDTKQNAIEKKLEEVQKVVDVYEKSEETQAFKETDNHLQTETDRADKTTKEAKLKKSKKKPKAKESEHQQTQEDIKQAELKEQVPQKHELELKLETEQTRDEQLIASETQDVEKIKKDAEMAKANQEENNLQSRAETKQNDAKTKQEKEEKTPIEKQKSEANILNEDVAVLQKDNAKNFEEACKLEEKTAIETDDNESERKSQKDSLKSKQAEEIKSTTEEISLLEDEKLTIMLEQKGITDEEQKKTQRKDTKNNQEAKLLKELENEREIANDGTKQNAIEKKFAEKQEIQEEIQATKETDNQLQTEINRVDKTTKEAKPKKSKKKTEAKESKHQQTQDEMKQAELKEQFAQKHELQLKLETEQTRDEQFIASDTQDVEKNNAEITKANQEENQIQPQAETKQNGAKIKQVEFLEKEKEASATQELYTKKYEEKETSRVETGSSEDTQQDKKAKEQSDEMRDSEQVESEKQERARQEERDTLQVDADNFAKELVRAEKLEAERFEAEKKQQEDDKRAKEEKENAEKKKISKKIRKIGEDNATAEAGRKQKDDAEKTETESLKSEKLEKERIEGEEQDRKNKQQEAASLSRKNVDEEAKIETEGKQKESKRLDAQEQNKKVADKKKITKKKRIVEEDKVTPEADRIFKEENPEDEKDQSKTFNIEEEQKLKQSQIKKEKEDNQRQKQLEAEKLGQDERLKLEQQRESKEGRKETVINQSEDASSEIAKTELENKAQIENQETENRKKEQVFEKKRLEEKLERDEKVKREELIKKQKVEADKTKKAKSKKRKEEEEIKDRHEKDKALKDKEKAERKRMDDVMIKEKKEQEAKEKEEDLRQEEIKKQEKDLKRIEKLEEEKLREDEENTRLEKKRVAKKKREEEEARLKTAADEAEQARKDVVKKRKEEEKLRLTYEQEQYEKREQEIRETDRRLREERRREIERDLNESTQEPKLTSEVDTSRESKPNRKQNGDVSANRETDGADHYIREYNYEPTRQKSDDRAKFVDHNHRDYTMEFMRPSGYREKTFEQEKFTDRESLGRSATIYKAQTIILDSQLRSSAPPQPDRSESERRTERYDRSDSERRVEKHRPKAISEARSLMSEKRSGLSRDLKRKPVFSTYLTDRTAVEGSRVKLTCSVLSSSDPKITWYKNGVLLDNKLKYKTKFMDGLITLEVLNAVVSDSAEYSCTAENENGSVNTSANLKVYPSFEASPIPPTFTRSIRDTYHLAENELVLECRIRGQPLPTITWLKDDKPISTYERYQAYYLADGVCRLAISSPTPEDSGKYTCKAENSVWTDQITHVVSFTGKESRLSPNIATRERSHFNRQALESRRPHFTNVLSDYKVAKGGTIGLQVEIRGCPTRVEWLREGRSVTEVYRNARTFVEQGLYTLALSDVTEKESGMYTCRAWSTHGNVDMNAAITVVTNELEGKPAIIAGRPEKDILISVGEDVNISFRVQGEPKPKVVFMKGIRDITTNQRVCKMTSDDYVKFTLKRSVVSDAGTYCILARNAYGCDRAFVTVVVRQRASSENLISDWTYPMDDSSMSIGERKYKSVPDRIPGEPNVVDGGNNWVSLAWPKADPRDTAPVLAYKIESWLLGKEGGARWVELGITPLNSFDVFNLKQGEEYHFRVTPRNRYGWGESVPTSTPVGIGLAGDRPEFVDILPGQLKVLAGETANLSCSVKGKPLPEIVWMKNGHEIEEESRMTTLYNGQDCSLTIKDISIEDEARYSCEASNVHGRASTYARVAVVMDRLIWEADAKLKRERSQDAEGDYPPQFTMRLRDRRVQATYPVRLTCQVVGNPPPSLTWFKDGETLVFDSRRNTYQDEHFHTLEIAPTTLEDGGVYEAMARNSSGAVSCRCSLVVDKGIRAYVAPEFCCGLEPLYRLSEGEELRISAVVEAYPSVGVTWYRDGVRLRPSRRAIMTLDRDGQIELALAFVTYRDAGVYTCTASNEVGRASTSGKVIVVEGTKPREKRTPPVVINTPDEPYSKEPMFVRKPRSSEAREGDTVIIACEVIGDPKPDVYWLRDFLKPDYYRDASHFKRVGDGPEYRFEIPHAKLDYTGAYSVVARNVHGEAKAIISLQIKAKDPSSTDDSHNVRYGRVEVIPRFDRELTDLLSYDGDAIEFECHVTGNPEPDIRWFHYNELIHDCPDFESSFDDGAARLKIKQVTAEDEGTYSCEASNNLGKAKSSACLVVYPPGEPNTLSQRLRRPPALLSAASTPRSTPRSTPARSVSRTPGPETSRLCSPSRQMAPSFYTYPFNKVVEEGDHVTFKCAVKGQPAPWATWDKDGIIITPSARFTIREKDELLRILEIEEVTIEDVGIYRITVENEFGRAEASARLEVITQKGKFYAGVRAYSPSPRKSLTYRRYPSVPRQD